MSGILGPTNSILTPGLPTQPDDERREFGDSTKTRQNIFNRVLQSAQKLQPISNTRHTLRLSGVDYADKDHFSLEEQKQAILAGKTLGRRLRGTWELVDNATGEVLDSRQQTIARVPYLTPRGTFINNGNEYTLINQARLRPGVFTRVKENGEIESHLNAKTGTGPSHRYFLDPEKGVFSMRLGQAKIPVMPLLKAMGATDKQLQEAWGNEIWEANAQQNNPAALNKLYQRLIRNRDESAPVENKQKAIAEAMAAMELDPQVTHKTLGKGYNRAELGALVDITKKLLAVSRGEQDVDDRDHLAFQTILGPEDLLSERLEKDYGGMRRELLRKASFRGNLGALPNSALTKQLESVLISSGLGSNLEEINTAELLDKQSRITRMGEGGISGSDAVPDEARSVQPSHYSFLDPARTPESENVGVDLYLANAVQKGKDGKIYTPLRDLKTGQIVYKSPQDLVEESVAFPGELKRKSKRVGAMQGGVLKFVPRDQVRYELPSFENAFSPLGNLIPMKSAMKAQRLAMGSRMSAQALPLENPEAPSVQAGIPGSDDDSYENKYGKFMGAIHAERPGRIVSASPNALKVKYEDGKTEDIELYNAFAFNRKSSITNTPVLQPGDTFKAGQLLAKSNYTDDQGVTALGKNLLVGYVPYKGWAFEDASVISESAAKKLTSEHMYQHGVDLSDAMKTGKRNFISLFPAKYDKKTLANLDDDGVIKPGTVVNYGDPLILAARQRDDARNKIHKKKAAAYSDITDTWEHHTPGVVTDVYKGPKGITAFVKSMVPTQVGDKLCYSPDTEVLTNHGWVAVTDITTQHKVASLNPATTEIEYVNPIALHSYDYSGLMYSLETTQASLLVTPNHNLYAKKRRAKSFELIPAENLFGKRYHLKNNGSWVGAKQETVVLPGGEVKAGQGGVSVRTLPDLELPVDVYLLLLGLFISEGNIVNHPASGSYGIDICQIKEPQRTVFQTALTSAGIKWNRGSNGEKIRIYSKQMMWHFSQFGKSHEKYLPDFVFDLPESDLRWLFTWLMLGDGHVGKTHWTYCTTSKKLAGDIQRLLLHLGMAGNIRTTAEREVVVNGYECTARERYDVIVYRKKNEPTINHGHVKRQGGQREAWESYSGVVYCPELPKNHVLYVRRNGKAVWCGNSNRYGGKGIISAIVPDDEMPRTADGRPLEIALNPLGVISRVNPAQIVETALGKIAAKTGKPYRVQDFDSIEDLVDFAEKELQKHGMQDLEDVIDPETDTKIPQVLVGNQFFMKLHHTADSKTQGRSTGGYSADETPAKGGAGDSSKRLSLLDLNSMLSHGSTAAIRDASVVRGQKNEDYWLAFMRGVTPPQPKVPRVYEKFVNYLKGSGINVVRNSTQLNIMALTDKDVEQLAGTREIQNGETVKFDKDLEPVKGGLFDPTLTGSHEGNRWSKIRLAQPLPNPVMEEPIRKILGLTQDKFDNIIAGKERTQWGTGPQAIGKALELINLDKELEVARSQIASGKRTWRDEAIKKMGYLKSAKELGIHPKDWMLSAVPVLPPRFRPVSTMTDKKLPLVSDPNYLYKEMIEANDNWKQMSELTDDAGDEQLAAYKAFKAVTGLGDPVHPKLVEKGVQGLLRTVFGSSPKFSQLQRRLLSTPVDVVGRAVIAPNPELDMDQVSLPEDKAWNLYKPFVVRRLKRRGLPIVDAMKAVENRSPLAKTEMLAEMQHRPVIINRAPVLHKYGIMAFWPQLTKHNTMEISPLVVKGFNADFDGDQMNFHVPVEDDARKEAIERLMPSANLLSAGDFKSPVHAPSQEYVGGLYAATAFKANKKPRTFRNSRDLRAAVMRGEVGFNDPVELLE